MRKQNQYKVSFLDWLLTILLLSISIGPLISFNSLSSSDNKKASVFMNDELISQLDLSQNKIFNLDHIVVEVNEGRVRVTKADCPRKVCVHTGWISRPSQTIVCVSNKILIEISGDTSEATYNVISY